MFCGPTIKVRPALLTLGLLAFNAASEAKSEDVVPCVNLFSPDDSPYDGSGEVNMDNVTILIEEIERRVLLSVSLSRPIEARQSSYVATACAARDKETAKQVLFYNPNWLAEMTAEGKSWELAFVIAHEIGHHLNDHSANDTLGSYRREFEADRFAGRVIFFLHGNIEEALKVFENYPYEGSETHPARYIREATARMGYSGDEVEFEGLPRFADLVKRPEPKNDAQPNTDTQKNIELLFSHNRDERLLAFSNLRAIATDDPEALSAMATYALENKDNLDGVYNVLSFATTQATNEAIAASGPSLRELIRDPNVVDNGPQTGALISIMRERIED